MTHMTKLMLSATAVLALSAAPTLAGDNYSGDKTMNKTSASLNLKDFSAYDADGNGEVSFAEFRKHHTNTGMSNTALAQRFVKMSAGNTVMTRDEFQFAMNQDEGYFDQPMNQLTRFENTAVLGNSAAQYDRFERTGEYQQPLNTYDSGEVFMDEQGNRMRQNSDGSFSYVDGNVSTSSGGSMDYNTSNDVKMKSKKSMSYDGSTQKKTR